MIRKFSSVLVLYLIQRGKADVIGGVQEKGLFCFRNLFFYFYERYIN